MALVFCRCRQAAEAEWRRWLHEDGSPDDFAAAFLRALEAGIRCLELARASVDADTLEGMLRQQPPLA
jgi:hypothetical protein